MSNVPKTLAEDMIQAVNARYREAEEQLARQREAEAVAARKTQREAEERAFAAEARAAHEAIESEDAAERKRYAERQAEAEARVIAKAAQRVTEEKAEAARVKAHGDALRDIVWYGANASEHAAPTFLEEYKIQVRAHEYRDWQEFEDRAREAAAATHQKLDAAIARSYARIEAEHIAGEAEARAKAKKELDAKIATTNLEAKKRAENVAHRRAINREIVAKIVLTMSEVHSGTGEEAQMIATAIVTALAQGAIPNCLITY